LASNRYHLALDGQPFEEDHSGTASTISRQTQNPERGAVCPGSICVRAAIEPQVRLKIAKQLPAPFLGGGTSLR